MKIKITIHPNSAVGKIKNKRTSIFLPDKDCNAHLIEFTSLVSETGNNAGCLHQISNNGKIKTTSINLSNDGLFNLASTLSNYINNVLASNTIVSCPNCNTFQEKSNKECINKECNNIINN
jgi:hypothetical protein